MSAVLPDTDLPGDAGARLAGATRASVGSPVPPAAAPTNLPAPPGLSAVQRLELSRAKIRAAMLPPPKTATLGGSGSFSLQHLLQRIPELPGVGFAIEAVSSWWRHHPLRPVAEIATEFTNVVARPTAQKNPLAMVGTAALVGAGLAWARPWRLLLRSALLTGFLPQLVVRVVRKLPLESWVRSLETTLQSRRAVTPVTPSTSAAMPSREVPPSHVSTTSL